MMKQCVKCDESKDISSFGVRKSSGNPESACRGCRNNQKLIASRKYQSQPHVVERKNRDSKIKRQIERRTGQRIEFYVFLDCRNSDKKKNRQNDLTLPIVRELLNDPCTYCGDNEGRKSLDRIDNNYGHTIKNVIVSCTRCNLTRGQMPYEAWLIVAPGMKVAREKGLFGDWDGNIRRSKSIGDGG